jgi:phosphonate transport system substrate-binding protein
MKHPRSAFGAPPPEGSASGPGEPHPRRPLDPRRPRDPQRSLDPRRTPELRRPLEGRRRALHALAAIGLAPWTGLATAAAGAPLRIALAPFLSPTALLNAFRPLREHLERELDRPVEMITEKDFRSLVEATRRLDHDVVQLPAHLARLAITDWRYQQLAGTIELLDVQVLVKAGGPVHDVAALKGQRVGMLDPLSLTATVGRRWLAQQGLADEVEVLALPSINSALFALDRGEVAMIVAGATQLAGVPPGTPRSERVLATVGNIPGPVYVARPTVAPAEVERIRAAMATFRPDPARPLSAANSVLRPHDAARLAALDPLAAVARQALAAAR